MIARALSLTILVSSLGTAVAQVALPERLAREVIEKAFANRCIPLLLGRHALRPIENAGHRQQLEFIQALGRTGIVRVIDLRQQDGKPFSWDELTRLAESPLGVDIEVAIRDDVDRSQLANRQGRLCLPVPPAIIERIDKIDPAKGGKVSKWDGAVVYFSYKQPPGSALYTELRKHLPPRSVIGDHVKARYLFRYDPLTSQWRNLIFDGAAMDEHDFRTNFVIEALQRD